MYPSPRYVTPGKDRQAATALRQFDRSLLPHLSPRWRHKYQMARRSKQQAGVSHRAKFFHGGPAMVAPGHTFSGTDDEVFGLHRLEVVIENVIKPLAKTGQIHRATIHVILEALRGDLAEYYHQVETAWRIGMARRSRRIRIAVQLSIRWRNKRHRKITQRKASPIRRPPRA